MDTFAHHRQSGIQAILQQATATHQISRQDYFQITSALLSSKAVGTPARAQINRLLDAIRSGEVRLSSG